jgi:hypothetical protein
MEISRNQVLFITISIIIGLIIGSLITQPQINNLNNEITISKESIIEKNNQIHQLEEQILIQEKEIEKLNSDLDKYQSEMEIYDIEILNIRNDYKKIENNYSELLELYNNLYFLENTYNKIDFMDYNEEDPDNKITVTSSRINWENFDRNTSRRIYRTLGKDYFEDFNHFIDFRINEINPGDKGTRTIIDLWSLCEDEDRYTESNSIILSAEQVGVRPDKYSIVFRQRVNGDNTFYYHQFGNLSIGINYYAVISRNDNLCQLQIFNDSERNNIVLDTGLITGTDSKYSFIILARSNEASGDFWASSSGYVENLRIKTS